MPRTRTTRRRYSKGAQRKVARVMREYKRGTLKGGAGRHPKVKSRAQAIAIGLSEARRAGKSLPPPRRRAAARRARR
jgi:hypothetical protein